MHNVGHLQTPLGLLRITAIEDAVTSVQFVDLATEETTGSTVLLECITQLREYFAEGRSTFDLPLNPTGTEFQRRIWKELESIPFAETRSYLQVSDAISNRAAIRAVGRANGENPIAIIIPCHRVIGSSGKLVGYAGGLWRKQWLLDHERKATGAMLAF